MTAWWNGMLQAEVVQDCPVDEAAENTAFYGRLWDQQHVYDASEIEYQVRREDSVEERRWLYIEDCLKIIRFDCAAVPQIGLQYSRLGSGTPDWATVLQIGLRYSRLGYSTPDWVWWKSCKLWLWYYY